MDPSIPPRPSRGLSIRSLSTPNVASIMEKRGVTVEPTTIGTDLTETDLDFVVGVTAPDALDKQRLMQLVRADEDFRNAVVGDERVFQRVMGDEEILVKVSPGLYFEVLLRRARQELELTTHTLERAGRQSIPVFDAGDVVRLLGRPDVLLYLADMLASFTRIRSYVVPVRVRRGVTRRVRLNDMDVDSLLRLCASVDEDQRFNFYKRIADLCLFLPGIFADHFLGVGRVASRHTQPQSVARGRRSIEDYEMEGRRFYRLAQRSGEAQTLRLSGVFDLLHQHFTSARKPLTFIATRYLHSHKHRLFGTGTQS